MYVGGHSAGGKAAIKWMQKNPNSYGGASFWDPWNNNAVPPFIVTKPVLIAYPLESGCSGQINDKNNGKYFYDHMEPLHLVKLLPYETPVAHNSLASTGRLGQMVCYSKADGFITSYGQAVARFIHTFNY